MFQNDCGIVVGGFDNLGFSILTHIRKMIATIKNRQNDRYGVIKND
jgi:hypothetical protein